MKKAISLLGVYVFLQSILYATAPVISNIQWSETGSSYATVTWTTDIPATTKIESKMGLAGSWTNPTEITTLTTSHTASFYAPYSYPNFFRPVSRNAVSESTTGATIVVPYLNCSSDQNHVTFDGWDTSKALISYLTEDTIPVDTINYAEYGMSPAYGTSTLTVTGRGIALRLSGLTPGGMLYYKIHSMTANGERTVTDAKTVPVNAPTINPDEILVLKNVNNSDSIEVADYYALKRNVPAENILALNFPGDASFGVSYPNYVAYIRDPLRAKLDANGGLLKNRIRFIMVPKGLPQNVDLYAINTVLCDPYDYNNYTLGAYVSNPYFNRNYRTSSPLISAGKYYYFVSLVTGSTVENAKGLIDKAIYAEKYVSPSSGTGYYDCGKNSVTDPNEAYYEGNRATRTASGINRAFSNSSSVVCDENYSLFGTAPSQLYCNNTMWYNGWYASDYRDVFDLKVGAVGWHLQSTSAGTLSGTGTQGNCWAGGFLNAGATASLGAVNEPYLPYFNKADLFYAAFFQGYTFAEAGMISTNRIYWMQALAGDPVYRLSNNPLTDNTAPVIANTSSTAVSGYADTKRLIYWETDDPCDTVVEYGLTSGYGNTISNDWMTCRHSAIISGLQPGTLYHYRIKTTDPAGNVATTADDTFTTSAPAGPSSPTCLTAAASTGSVMLSWTANTESDLAGYKIYRNTQSGASGRVLAGTVGLVRSFADTGLVNGQNYYYVISAIDTFSTEGSLSLEVNATPSGSLTALTPVVSNILFDEGTTSVTVSWNTDVPSRTRLEYGPTAAYGSFTTEGMALTTAHSQVISGLSVGGWCHFRVVANTGSMTGYSLDVTSRAKLAGLTNTFVGQGGGYQVWLTPLSGAQVQLTNDGIWRPWAALSPDGTKIAYCIAATNLYIMDIDGQNSRPVANYTYSPAYSTYSIRDCVFSADGLSIYFVTYFQEGRFALYKINTNGTNLTRIGDFDDTLTAPRVSPNGKKIVFASGRANATSQIYIMNSDGSDLIRLTNNSASDTTPSFSPDGSKILFTSDRFSGVTNVFVMNTDGSAQTQLTSSSNPWNCPFNPSWKADGSKIYYLEQQGYRLANCNPDGSGYTTMDLSSYQSSVSLNTTYSAGDSAAPVLSAIASSNITDNAARITWTTNENSDSQVLYGVASGIYDFTVPVVYAPVTSHTVDLSGLFSATTYYYVVKSIDANGNLSVSAENSFVTAGGGTLPVVSGVTPNSVYNNSATTLTINGSNFTGATLVKATGPSTITLTGWSVSSNTVIAGAVMASGATAGTYSIIVTNASGSNAVSSQKLVVSLPVPVVTGVSPLTGSNLATLTLSITGSGFTGMTLVKITGPTTVTLTGAAVVSDTIINNAVLASGAKVGAYDVIVTNPAGSNATSTQKLTITTTAPAVTVITPNSGTFGTAVSVNLTGTNFFAGLSSSNLSAVKIYPSGSTLTGYAVVNTTSITGVIIPANTNTGVYTIKATTYDGGEGAGVTYTVNAPAPTVTNITPTYGINSQGTTISIFGSGFFGGRGSASVTSINLDDGPSTAFSSFSVVSDTLIRNAVVPGGIGVGSYNVKVTTNGGTNAASAVKYESQPAGVAPIVSSVKAGPSGIFITYSLNMNQTSVTTIGNYTVKNGAGTTITPSVSTYDDPSKTVNLSVTSSSSYTVTASTNISAASTSTLALTTFAITTDLNAPSSCTNTINGGAAYTALTTVTLTLTASDANTVTQMRFNTGSGYGSAEAYTTTKILTISSGDGVKTVSAQFKDSVGNWSADVSDTIILDTAGPTGTVNISAGATYTSNVATTLALSATDTYSTVVSMRFSNDGSTWSTARVYGGSDAWTLGGSDGVKTVYVQFSDGAGNWSGNCTDTITLDTLAPTGSFTINNGATRVNSTVVTLSFNYSDAGSGVTNIRYQGNGSTWITTGTTGTALCTTTTGDGAKPIYVGYKDGAGSWSTVISNSANLCTVALFKVEGPLNGRVLSGTGFTIKASAMITAATPTTAFNYLGVFTTTDSSVVTIPEKNFTTGTATVTVTLSISGKQSITVSDKDIPTVTGTITLKVFGYKTGVNTTGTTITNSSGAQVDIPAGAIAAGIQTIGFAPTENPVTPSLGYRHKDTLNPISYDFGILDIATMTLSSVTFDKKVKITIPYEVSDLGTGVNEKALRVFYYNTATGEYEIVEGQQTVANGSVSCMVTHFSTYRVLITNFNDTLDNVIAYPQPFIANGTSKIKFINMPENCTLHIYNVAGEKAIELNEADMVSKNTGYIDWDGKNTSGDAVAKGVYIYVVKSPNGMKKTGKIVLTK